MVKEGKIYNAI